MLRGIELGSGRGASACLTNGWFFILCLILDLLCGDEYKEQDKHEERCQSLTMSCLAKGSGRKLKSKLGLRLGIRYDLDSQAW